jgi:hypothetical protein
VRQDDTTASHLQGSFGALGTGQFCDGQLEQLNQKGALSRDLSDGLRTGFHLDCALSCRCHEACLRAQTNRIRMLFWYMTRNDNGEPVIFPANPSAFCVCKPI